MSQLLFPFIAAFFVGFGLVNPPHTWAHPDLLERIERLTEQISKQPGNAQLYLQRAEIFREHEQYPEALKDLTEVERLQPAATIVQLATARVYYEAGEIANALTSIDHFLALKPNHAEALVIRARCRLKLDQVVMAIHDFTRALESTAHPEPDLFLERAQAQASAGQWTNAVKGLDEGIARIGSIPQLQLPAIEYERKQNDFPAALARLDKIIARQPVKDPWLVLRGEVLEQAGRLNEAQDAFKSVLATLQDYSPARRNLESNQELATRAQDGIARIGSKLKSRTSANR